MALKRPSAGLLMYRLSSVFELFLVHPGGPYWAGKDVGAWTLPKGQFDPALEEPLHAAVREFREETGFEPVAPYLPLGRVMQRNGRLLHAWAFVGTCDARQLRSNTFTMRWPPDCPYLTEFPEVDEGSWLTFPHALRRISPDQRPFLETLARALPTSSAG